MVIDRTWDTSKWLTIEEAAKRAGVCRKSMFNWIKAGHVRVWKTPGGKTRVDPESLVGSVIEYRAINRRKVTRLEVHGPDIRYIARPVKVELSVQDGGKTLKIYIEKLEVPLEPPRP